MRKSNFNRMFMIVLVSSLFIFVMAGSAMAASGNSSSSFNLGKMFTDITGNVNKVLEDPLTWAYDNISRLAFAVPILCILALVAKGALGSIGGGGRTASDVATDEKKIQHIICLTLGGLVGCGLIWLVYSTFVAR